MTRRRQPQPLTTIESLLLAQAVWEYGAAQSSWSEIARLLSQHPLLSRPKSFFTPQSCHSMYELLLKDANLEPNDLNNAVHAPINLQLAQKHYHSRFLELRELIMAEELKFKTILREIEEIKVGLRDKEVQAKITGGDPARLDLARPLKESIVDQPFDEELTETTMSQLRESKASSPSASHIGEDKNEMEDVRLEEEENDRETSEVLNQRQEEEEEDAHREAEGMEEEEEAYREAEGMEEEEEAHRMAEGMEEEEEAHRVAEGMEEEEEARKEAAGMEEEEEAHREAEEKEDEEEVHREAEEIEEEEASKGGDNRKEEEEENKGEDQEEIKPLEEMENQEEMESNVIVTEGEGEESEEEETETNPVAVDNSQERHNSPQGQDETDVDLEQDDQTNVGNNAELDMESESEIAATPAEIPPSPSSLNLAEAVDDEQASEDEPVTFTRRSSRRRKFSAASLPLPPTRKRLRSRGRISELEPQLTVDSENDSEIRDDYPQVDDDRISSPFDGEGSMTQRRDGKRKASFVESAESPPDKKRLREDSEPAEEEDPGPSSHNTRTRSTRHTMRTEEQVAFKRFQNVIGMLHSQISQHRNGNIFHNPIKNSEAPDYREIVKHPMDLKTIKTRVKDGVIVNSLEFQRDIFLMFANAMMYNRPGSDVHAMAEDMMLESEGQILAFRQTEGIVKRGQRP